MASDEFKELLERLRKLEKWVRRRFNRLLVGFNLSIADLGARVDVAAAAAGEAAAGAGEAQAAAEQAQATAEAAQSTAEEASGAAGEAVTKAEAATQAASEAKATAEGVAGVAEAAQAAAQAAQATAEAAQVTAETASEAAEAAQASVTGLESQVASNTSDISSLSGQIGTLSYNVGQAAGLASEAKDAAEAAASEAAAAKAGADSASQAAAAAQTAAGTAQATADEAKVNAASATTAAGEAQTAADKAQATAETAQATADSKAPMYQEGDRIEYSQINGAGYITAQGYRLAGQIPLVKPVAPGLVFHVDWHETGVKGNQNWATMDKDGTTYTKTGELLPPFESTYIGGNNNTACETRYGTGSNLTYTNPTTGKKVTTSGYVRVDMIPGIKTDALNTAAKGTASFFTLNDFGIAFAVQVAGNAATQGQEFQDDVTGTTLTYQPLSEYIINNAPAGFSMFVTGTFVRA